MDVGASMLVSVRDWRAVRGVILLLSTLATMLGRVNECVLSTGAESSGSRLVLLPVRSVGTRTRRLSWYDRAERGFPAREPAHSVLPAIRASSRSHSSV